MHARALSQSIQELCPFCDKINLVDCIAIETSRREFVVSFLMVKIKVQIKVWIKRFGSLESHACLIAIFLSAAHAAD
jgi:hypothetical protein